MPRLTSSLFWFSLCASSPLVACGGSTTGPDGAAGSPGSGGSGNDWTRLHECTGTEPSDDIQVQAASIAGDTLTLEVGHGGGCEEHAYGLCYEGEWAESEPVQVRAQVLHDANEDGCEAFLNETLEFDLTALRSEFERRYQTEQGSIELLLDTESVVYRFGQGTPTFEDIERQAEALDSCNTVSDCKPLGVGCGSVYVNKDADTTQLEADIQAYHDAEFDGTSPVCPASCACGVLTCTEGDCTTEAGDCSNPPPDAQSICL